TTIDPTPISIGATVSGSVWRDLDSDRERDGGEAGVAGWRAELVLTGNAVGSALTDATGQYQIRDVSPGPGYQLRFVEPSTGMVFGSPVPNEQGIAPAPGTRDDPDPVDGVNNGNPAGATVDSTLGTLTGLTLLAGDNIIEQSLPLDPAGVVYD